MALTPSATRGITAAAARLAPSGPMVVLLGARELVSGLKALEQAKAYEAQVEVCCAKIDHAIVRLNGRRIRCLELADSIDSLCMLSAKLVRRAESTAGSSEKAKVRSRCLKLAETIEKLVEIDV